MGGNKDFKMITIFVSKLLLAIDLLMIIKKKISSHFRNRAALIDS